MRITGSSVVLSENPLLSKGNYKPTPSVNTTKGLVLACTTVYITRSATHRFFHGTQIDKRLAEIDENKS